jgi:hypothetical protein
MKLALIVDNCRQESFELRDSKSYSLGTDIPYQFTHSIKNECHIGFWSYPKILGDGVFIKITNAELPNLDLDVIIVVLELDNWKENLDRIRHAYKNAIILGTIKEPNRVNIDFLNSCDKIAIPFLTQDTDKLFRLIGQPTKEVFLLPQPVDTNYLYDNFFTETKKIQLFQYNHHVHTRRGSTAEFCKYISDKYSIPIVSTNTTHDNLNQWRDFILSWRESLFHINLDPYCYSVQQTGQCATLGVINFGGCTDPAYSLFPSTATNDFYVLEQEIYKCINDHEYMISLITDAWERVNKIYSIEAVQQILLQNI